MKARYLWTTWAYLAVLALLALEVFFIFFSTTSLVPKLQKFARDGWIRSGDSRALSWMYSFLNSVQSAGRYALWWLLAIGAGWGLFEWRVRNDNKTLMRLSILGTGAVAGMIVVIIMAAALVIPFMVGLPSLTQVAKPYATEKMNAVHTSLIALERSLANNDWKKTQENARQTLTAVRELQAAAPALPALMRTGQTISAPEVRAQLLSAHESMQQAAMAAQLEDAEQCRKALEKFKESFGSIEERMQAAP
jgi:hypothetical protein